MFQTQTKIHWNRQKFLHFWLFPVNFEPFSSRSLQDSFKRLLDFECSLFWTFAYILTPKRFKKYKLHENEVVEIFRLLWSHCEVFLKQNTATSSSNNVRIQSSFFFVFELILLEFRTIPSEIVQKMHQNPQEFFDSWGYFWGHCFYKKNLSRDKSSRKQHVRPCLRLFIFLVHEVYRYSDKIWTKIMKVWNF